MEHEGKVYIDFDAFDGDRDVDIRLQTVKIVKTRKEHTCVFSKIHIIKKGFLVRYESAIVDGKWGSYYMCIPCLDKWFKEVGLP